MPQINLLLTASGKKKKTKSLEIPKIEIARVAPLSLTILYAIIGVLVFVWLVLSFIITKDKRELSILEKKGRRFSVSPQESKNISLRKEQLNNKAMLLDGLSSRKFLWSEKLELLAGFVPEGLWLTEISLNKISRISPDAKRVKSKDKEKDKDKEVHLDRYELFISGSAFAYKIQDAINLIGKFNNLLKESQDFARDFSEIKLSNVAKASIGKTDIMNFEFILSLR